jgi:prepilin-type N-terminal cleavage/methylation domain-containing protein
MMRVRGFTLVELLVALTIAGIVVLLTHQIFATVTDGMKRLEMARRELDSEQLGIRWLDAAFLSLEAGNGGAGFEGHRDHVTFSSWLMTPNGWVERSSVALRHDRNRLVAATADGDVEVLGGVTALVFDYLLDPGLHSRWVTDWVSPLTAPLGVRLRLERPSREVDTLLFLIKGRG